MIRDLRRVIERERAEIGVFLTLPRRRGRWSPRRRRPGSSRSTGFAPVPRIQVVTVEEAMRLRDRAVQLPARRDDTFKRAAREEAPERQGKLGL